MAVTSICTVLLIGTVTPHSALASNNGQEDTGDETGEIQELSMLEEVEDYISLGDDEFYITDESSVQNALSEEERNILNEELEERNNQLESLIKDAESNPDLTLVEENNTVVVTKQEEVQDLGEFNTTNNTMVNTTDANVGETSISFGITRATINLSRNDVQAVINAGASGGGAAIGGALGIKTGPGAAITASALSAAGASLVQSYATAVPLTISVLYIPPYMPRISRQ